MAALQSCAQLLQAWPTGVAPAVLVALATLACSGSMALTRCSSLPLHALLSVSLDPVPRHTVSIANCCTHLNPVSCVAVGCRGQAASHALAGRGPCSKFRRAAGVLHTSICQQVLTGAYNGMGLSQMGKRRLLPGRPKVSGHEMCSKATLCAAQACNQARGWLVYSHSQGRA